MSKRLKDIVFAAVLVIGVSVFALSGRSSAISADYTFEGEPEVVAASFVSAWCSTCKILEPRLAKIVPDFADKPIKFVEFDFTFGQREEIALRAEEEGVGAIYPQFEGATGFTVLVDHDTGEIIDILTISYSPSAMRAAIAQAIAVASAS